MTKKTISITRALAELKNLDARIVQASQRQFVSRTIGKGANQKVYSSSSPVAAVETELKANLQSVLKLISNREALKKAIVLSNASTVVKLNNRELTVAEAIELKSSIVNKQTLLNNLRQQLTLQIQSIDNSNAALDAEINKLVTNIYGADKAKINDDTYTTVATPQKAVKEQVLLDPNNVTAVITVLEDEVNQVRTELDFLLSESNARTEVEVDFD